MLRRPVRKVCSPESPSDAPAACMCWEVILEDLDTNPTRPSEAGSTAHPPEGKRGLCLNPNGYKLSFLKKNHYSLKKKMYPREVLTGEMMEPVSLFRDSASPASSREPGWRAAHGQPRSWTTFPHRRKAQDPRQTFHMERSLLHFVGFTMKA